ncbi:uncharacterized protein LOC144782883 [Lissotriton helveticus]
MAASWVCYAAFLLLGSAGLPQALPMDDNPEGEVIRVKTVQLLGGWNPLDVTSKKAKEMAEFTESVNKADENDKCKYHTVKILAASYQVVNGYKFRLKLKMIKNGCGQGSSNGNIQSETLQCDVSIMVDNRMQQKKLQDKSCTPVRA